MGQMQRQGGEIAQRAALAVTDVAVLASKPSCNLASATMLCEREGVVPYRASLDWLWRDEPIWLQARVRRLCIVE